MSKWKVMIESIAGDVNILNVKLPGGKGGAANQHGYSNMTGEIKCL